MIVERGRVAAALRGYDLGDEIGAGSFGLVFAARHRRLGRDVAVKVLVAGQDGADAGIAEEARLLAGFDHPHIVRVFDYVEGRGLRMIIMELLAGGSLADRHDGMPPEGACAVGLAVAGALACAHSQGVLHRDIKPANMLFDGAGVLKVADFGIAKIVEGSAATASGLVGTPRYMAPEQAVGGRLGPATDLYALGVVLYELLAGGPLFGERLPVAALAHHHMYTRPAPPAGVPTPVADVVMRVLAKDPAERHASAWNFAIDLAAAATRGYGTGWPSRAGIVLRLGDDILGAAERPRGIPPPPRTHVGPARPAADGRAAARGGVGAFSQRPTVPAGADAPAVRAGPTGPTGPVVPPAAPSRRGRVFAGLTRVARRRWVVVPVAAALTLAIVLPLLFLARGADQDGARGPDRDAVSRRLAAEVRRVQADQPELARRLAIAAHHIAPTRQALYSLLGTVDPALATLATFTGHTDVLTAMEISPDGATIATASFDGTLRFWDATERGEVTVPLATARGIGVHFSPDGVAYATVDGENVVLGDARRGSLGEPLAAFAGPTEAVLGMEFSPDGASFAVGSLDGTVRLWDARGRGSVAEPLATFGSGDTGAIWFIDFTPRTPRLPAGDVPVPPGAVMAATSNDGTARLWDANSRGTVGEPLATFVTGHTDFITDVAFSPGGAILATASDDRTIRLWDATGRGRFTEPLATFTGHTALPSGIDFSPDGAILAASSLDGTIRLWDVAGRGDTAEPLAVFSGITGAVHHAVFSPDGAILAAANFDGTVRLWDAAGRGRVTEPLATFTGHTDSVDDVQFSSGGTSLATASHDRTVRLWDVDPASLTARACADQANQHPGHRFASGPGPRISAAEWEQYVPELPYDPACD